MKTHRLEVGQFIEFIVPVKEMKKKVLCELQTHSANAEATGSNPVEAPKTLFGLNLRLLKSQSQLR